MKIELVRGAEARQLAEEQAFRGAWRALVDAETKLALVQAPEFVLPWYRSYGESWTPLLVLGRATDGELLGLLPLAQRRSDGRLAHAGAEQAEYHGWLVRPGGDEEFLVPALAAVRREVGFSAWNWRWLPPGAADGWIAAPALARAGIHVVAERRPSPVWDLTQRDTLDKAYDNRSLRGKRNRYKRRGELRLERVTDPARTRALLAELAAQCDFRQEAIHGVRPFADDPHKAEFFAARQEFPAASHFSVLWCGTEALAFHFGGCDGRTCLLGLSSYAPHEGKHSPGTLLLVELARRLAEEGTRTLDLTPGTDAYKQRFATGQQELVRLRLGASRVRRVAVRVLAGSRAALAGGGGGNGLVRAERLERWRRGLRGAREQLAGGPGGLIRHLAALLFERRTLECFRLEPGTSAELPPTRARTRVQAFADLQTGANGRSAPERRALVSEALERFADGEVLYTVSAAGVLARIGWRASGSSGALHAALVAAGLLAREGELLSLSPDLQGEPTALSDCVARMLAEREAPSEAGLVLCLPRAVRTEREALERLGFRACGRAERRRVLGREPAWSVRGGS